MKKIFLTAIILLVALASCNNNPAETVNTNNPASVQVQDTVENRTGLASFTEQFTGTVNGTALIFEHKDYTRYWLSENGQVSEGVLNTERGFGNDEDATVYVLNADKPEKEQKIFVRYTNGELVMLDAERKVMPGVELKNMVQ